MALRGIKVIELVGLAPAPFCGLILSDFGAKVIRVDRVNAFESQLDCMKRGKKSIAVDLKCREGQNIVRKLCSNADVLIEPFRPGVMEKLGLGPNILTEENKKLIYARLSGYGQTGPLANAAGHDINMAISGVLSLLGRKNEIPFPPINLLGDFAGGGLMCALGICLALIERNHSSIGQVIDASIVEGINYLSTFLWNSRQPDKPVSTVVWPNKDQRGHNTLDSGAPMYNVYRTKENKFIAIGALEVKFFQNLFKKLNLNENEFSPLNLNTYEEMSQQLTKIFSMKTQQEWCEFFHNENEICFTPVVDFSETHLHAHHLARNSFLSNATPKPAPLLSRTPAQVSLREPEHNEHTKEILIELGYKIDEIVNLSKQAIISITNEKHKL